LQRPITRDLALAKKLRITGNPGFVIGVPRGDRHLLPLRTGQAGMPGRRSKAMHMDAMNWMIGWAIGMLSGSRVFVLIGMAAVCLAPPSNR
jgi:hypothetical protein